MDEGSDLSWILEFALTQPISPSLLHRLTLSLPSIPSSPRIKKALLLRRLIDLLPSLSVQILLTLELIVHVHTQHPHLSPSHNPSLLRSAYLHAAVGATLSPLRRGDTAGFLLAVDRIWRRRVFHLQSSGQASEALVAGELLEAKKMMEEASTSKPARDEVMATWVPQEGVDAVAEYAKAEFEAMGLLSREGAAAERERRGENEAVSLPVAPREKNRENVKRVLPSSLSESNIVPTPEVERVRQALKRSSKDLHSVVEDPLPHAKEVADNLLARNSEAAMHLDEPIENRSMPLEDNHCKVEESAQLHSTDKENQGKVNVSAQAHSIDKENQSKVDSSAQAHSMDGRAQSHSLDKANENMCTQRTKDLSKAPICSLMDRNPTAQTFEWEDEALDSSCEDGTNPPIHLPTPRAQPSSPLKALNVKTAKGRKRRRWSTLEEDTLRKAVGEYGRGSWKQILNCYREIFEERTEVDLKDKWRNLIK